MDPDRATKRGVELARAYSKEFGCDQEAFEKDLSKYLMSNDRSTPQLKCLSRHDIYGGTPQEVFSAAMAAMFVVVTTLQEQC